MNSQRTKGVSSAILWFVALLAALAVACLLMLAGCGAPAEENAPTEVAPEAEETQTVETATDENAINVEVTIVSSVADHELNESKTVVLPAGSTVYDTLEAAGIEYQGTGSFVTSIEGIENGSEGEMSGWTYTVNGEVVMEAANAYELANGDSVEWSFSTDF